jgi:hypothetical protein
MGHIHGLSTGKNTPICCRVTLGWSQLRRQQKSWDIFHYIPADSYIQGDMYIFLRISTPPVKPGVLVNRPRCCPVK